MNTPHPGFRRAAAASWSLAAIGVAGVAGASLLAWADTLEKQGGTAMPDTVEQPPLATYGGLPTTTTSMAPSYAPQIHTRSRGS